jgi:uncharacterized membrane protein
MGKEDNPRLLHPSKIERTRGQRAADRLTAFIGSWIFIITLGVILLSWIILNVTELIEQHWDPFPFILLNLVVGCLAAIQAPIILMSQKRAEERDRLSSHYDYAVNRKSEREIEAIKKQLTRIEKKIR